jgi:hypothetical protein
MGAPDEEQLIGGTYREVSVRRAAPNRLVRFASFEHYQINHVPKLKIFGQRLRREASRDVSDPSTVA